MRTLSVSSEKFQTLAYQLSSFASNYLSQLDRLPTYPPQSTGPQTESLFAEEIPLEGLGDHAFDSLAEIFEHSRPASPRFFGYIFGSGEPVGMLGEFAASVLHQNVTSWRSAPAAVTIEHTVVRWLAHSIGCGEFKGCLTLGGSTANLMGLCMAREANAPANQTGVRHGSVIYCSSETHFSVHKAAALLGLGHKGVRVIEVDQTFRMPINALRQAISDDLKEGKIPVAIVANAGTTATGSIDPLSEIADLCREFGIWFHVDGAYGALAVLAIPESFQGLARADSISIDAHKWLYQPTGSGCILYRDRSAAEKAFSYSEEYAKPLSDDTIEGFAFFHESIELSRPFRALRLWLSMRYHGLKAFRESIQEDLRLAQVLKKIIDATPCLEMLAPVPLSVVCFRYKDKTGDLNILNQAILNKVIQRGRVYISNAEINGAFALRACIVNHRSTDKDMQSVVDEVLAAAEEIIKSDGFEKSCTQFNPR